MLGGPIAPLLLTLLSLPGAKGSTSTIWQRRSFWDDGYDSAAIFPLYSTPLAARDGDTGGGASGSRQNSDAWPPAPPASHVVVGATVAALGSLARGFGRLVLDGAEASAGHEGGPAEEAWAMPGPSTRQRQAALRMLQRSVVQLCAHELGVAGAPAPPPWGPFALLAALCAGLARPQARDAAGVVTSSAVPTSAPPALGRVAESAEGDSGDESDWQHVEDVLPPPPSCTDDELALWERCSPSTRAPK